MNDRLPPKKERTEAAHRADRQADWLSPAQVCERVPGLTVAHLQDLRKKGRGPRYFKPTLKTVIYAAADVDAWVRASVQETRDSRR